METFATVLSFHLPSHEATQVLDTLDGLLTPQNAERAGWQGLLCLEMGQGKGRSQVFVISLWDGTSLEEAEDLTDRCSAVVADIVGGGIARHRANVLRAIPGPEGTWARDGTSISKTQPLDVLVLEDEAAMAETSADVLRAAGFTVATSANVDEALVVITSRVVGSVLVDHEKAQRFLAEGRDLPPVIVLSDPGSDVLSKFQVAEIERLFACLSMPVARADLITVVKAALGHRESGAGDVTALRRDPNGGRPPSESTPPSTTSGPGRWKRQARSRRR